MINKSLIFILLFSACSIGADNSAEEIINETTISSTIPSTTTSTTTTSPSTTITTTTTTTTVPVSDLITMHHPSERAEIIQKYGYGQFIDIIPGYEGDFNKNLLIQLAINELPDPFRTILKEEIIVLNGCHPYGKVIFKRCVYGVFDPVGFDETGNYGNDWAKSIWISDRGLESGHLKDILLHEAAHAYSFNELRYCKKPGGQSYRSLAHQKFGGEENLADIFVYYFGGKWTNYYQQNNIEYRDRSWMKDMIEYCDLYQQALSAFSS